MRQGATGNVRLRHPLAAVKPLRTIGRNRDFELPAIELFEITDHRAQKGLGLLAAYPAGNAAEHPKRVAAARAFVYVPDELGIRVFHVTEREHMPSTARCPR